MSIHNITAAKIDQIVELVEEGSMLKQACDECGVEFPSLKYYRKLNPDTDNRIVDALDARVRTLLKVVCNEIESGGTISGGAKKAGVCHSTVNNWRKKYAWARAAVDAALQTKSTKRHPASTKQRRGFPPQESKIKSDQGSENQGGKSEALTTFDNTDPRRS